MTGAAAPLAVIAGGGDLPVRVVDAAIEAGRAVSVVVLEGQGRAADFAHLPHLTIRLGAAGQAMDWLRARGVRQVVFIGAVARPSLLSLRPDAGAARLVARVGRAALLGDDALLTAVLGAVAAEGFEVLPAQAFVRGLLPGPGLLGTAAPDALARADIARGAAVLRALGAADVGQAVVVQQGLVLGVEAIEGTDALLARCGPLRRAGPGGVLVKLPKPGQSRLADLPTIGPATIAAAVTAGLRGFAIAAGATLLVDRAETIAAADRAGLFVLSLDPEPRPGDPP